MGTPFAFQLDDRSNEIDPRAADGHLPYEPIVGSIVGHGSIRRGQLPRRRQTPPGINRWHDGACSRLALDQPAI